METYLPIIQATLAEWLQLTIDHPLYAAALVIGVWLLTALLYSITIAGLKKKNIASERLRTSAETELSTAQQHHQQAQTELASTTEQLAQAQKLADLEKQRANTAEQLISERNQHCAATIQTLASSFDIGERPLPVIAGIFKADDLWQQHDKVIKQLIDRLHTEQQAKTELEKFYQAEKTKLAETEANMVRLQTSLDSQASLVLALQTQTTSLQQQQNDTQRDLTEALKKHQADLTRLLQLEQQASSIAHTQSTIAQATIVTEEAVVSPSVAVDDSATKMQDLLNKPQPAPVILEPEISVLVQVAEPEPIIPEPVSLNETTDITPVAPIIEPEPLVIAKPTIADVVEKTPKTSALKGLYKKFTPSKAEPKTAPIAEPKQTPEKSSKGTALKGLYKKLTTSKPEQTEPAPILPIVKPEPMPVMQVAEPEPAPVTPIIEPVTKAELIEKLPEQKPSNTTQLQGLYPKHTSPKIQIKDLAPESFDNSSSKLEDVADQITEKLEKMKGLYGKMFSKNKE